MPAGKWGTTNRHFKPGAYIRFGPNHTAAQISSRLTSFFTPSRLAFWGSTGIYFGAAVRNDMKNLYVDHNTTPTGDTSDPNNACYNWSRLDAIAALPQFSDNLVWYTGMGFTEGRAPGWFNGQGWIWTNSNGDKQIRLDLAACQNEIKNVIKAILTRYGTDTFWRFGISECLFASSSTWPSGFTRALQNQGHGIVLNYIFDQSGGLIEPTFGANTGAEVQPYMYNDVGVGNPDPKLFNSSCSVVVSDGSWPNCSSGSARRFMQDQFQIRPIGEAYESNGMTVATWPTIPNPFGHAAGYSAVPTAAECMWYYSSEGVIPAHIHEFYLYEDGGHPNINATAVAAALDAYMAGGSNILPALPSSYDITPPSGGGSGTWSHVADGTGSSAGTPGQPSGKAAGDLLIYITAARSGSETANDLSAWGTRLDNGSATAIAVWGRYATGDSNDDMSTDPWSGTSSNYGIISAFRWSGTAAPSLASIVVASAYSASANNNDMPNAALTVPVDKCITIGAARKQKTTTSNGATVTSPSGLSNRIGFYWSSGSVLGFVCDYEIQTTATDISASIWDQSVNENTATDSVLLALGPGSDTVSAPAAPSGTPSATSVTQTSFTITHNDSSGADGYKYYDTTSGTAVFIGQQTQSQKTSNGGFPWSGLIANTTYKFKVRAYNSGGESALSSEGTQATSSPSDTTAPTFGGLTSATFDSGTRDITLVWTQGTDAVTAQASLWYDIYAAISPNSISYTTPLVSVQGVSGYVLQDPAEGTWSIVVRCRDSSGNSDTNTTARTATVTSMGVGTIGPCDNGSGSPQTGQVYLFTAPNGVAFPPIDPLDPSTGGTLITLESDGTYLYYDEVGDYQWQLRTDDPWLAEGEVTVS
ncbi:MAG: hypothetical protein AB7Q00_15030 [Phycisphaerales bacterium]